MSVIDVDDAVPWMPKWPGRTRCSFSPAMVLTGYLQISAIFVPPLLL